MAIGPSPLSAGTPVRAKDFPRAQSNYDQTTAANIASTSYSATATDKPSETSVRVCAPTSGKIGVSLHAGPRNNSATVDRLYVTYRVLEGDPNSGTLIQTDDVKYGVSNAAVSDAADDYSYGSHFTVVGGLTPGTYYYFQLRYRTSLGGGTADLAFTAITCWPLP